MAPSGMTKRLTRRSATASDNRKQLVTLWSLRSKPTARQTNMLPRPPAAMKTATNRKLQSKRRVLVPAVLPILDRYAQETARSSSTTPTGEHSRICGKHLALSIALRSFVSRRMVGICGEVSKSMATISKRRPTLELSLEMKIFTRLSRFENLKGRVSFVALRETI